MRKGTNTFGKVFLTIRLCIFGKIYTLPNVMEVIGYWYNEELFQKAGIVGSDGKVKSK